MRQDRRLPRRPTKKAPAKGRGFVHRPRAKVLEVALDAHAHRPDVVVLDGLGRDAERVRLERGGSRRSGRQHGHPSGRRGCRPPRGRYRGPSPATRSGSHQPHRRCSHAGWLLKDDRGRSDRTGSGERSQSDRRARLPKDDFRVGAEHGRPPLRRPVVQEGAGHGPGFRQLLLAIGADERVDRRDREAAGVGDRQRSPNPRSEPADRRRTAHLQSTRPAARARRRWRAAAG